MADLKKLYEEDIRPKLKESLGLSNVMEVPKITQITLNMGVGEALSDREAVGRRGRRYGTDCGSKACGRWLIARSLALRCVKAGRSAARSRFAGVGCMSFSIA